ncbi:MAG: cytochrome c biogenesis protein ResB [Candidatus Cryptobacteroides sp.]
MNRLKLDHLAALTLFLSASVVLQLVVGDIPSGFFAFPVSLSLFLLWCALCLVVWSRRQSWIRGLFLSSEATIFSISACALGCLVTGFSSTRAYVNSWWFAADILLLLTTLFFVLLRGWRDARGRIRWGFVLNHKGLLIMVSSLFFGAPDTQVMRLPLSVGESAKTAWTADGTVNALPFELQMLDYSVDFYDNGLPQAYRAEILVDGVPRTVEVNSPATAGFSRNVYLVSSSEDYCVFEVVGEPWKYLTLLGLVMMIAGAAIMFIKGPTPKKRESV